MATARCEVPGTQVPGLPWRRRPARWGIWWIPDEAPGGLGSPELWMDEAALEGYLRGDAAPAVTAARVHARSLVDALVRFDFVPALAGPAVYIVDIRRTSTANLNRPYYVLKQAAG